ncbi:hypothetical protein V1J52_15380 [Streptomyces sp. TRM 70351]|uniref:hypothetical protein n=1 Tax=Streptomyces sp. TRM 70351 TaxID=3116552 RepID=UPI002E7B0ACD|nr:hypothetical protein [Streptomyces sp. TRM 70351]MEE1929549.1 hypothetical protein [Streptomyces sp. TRM 70351]
MATNEQKKPRIPRQAPPRDHHQTGEPVDIDADGADQTREAGEKVAPMDHHQTSEPVS